MNPNQLLRKEPKVIEASNKKRGAKIDLSRYQAMEIERKKLQADTEDCQMNVNRLSKEVAVLKRESKDASEVLAKLSDLSAQKKKLEHALKELLSDMRSFELTIPNVLEDSVPEGKGEEDNVEVFSWGEKKKIVNPKSHTEIAKEGLDFARAAKISGSRFVFLKDKIARLHRALGQWMLDEQIKKGYEEVNPPLLVQENALYGTGQLPKFAEEQFFTLEYQHALIPTAEVSLTNMYQDEIVSEYPLSYVALTPCFRSEAGAYGKDTHGLIRLHQFEKVELVKFVDAKTAEAEFEALIQDAESILQQLELPYRKMLLCGKDTGFSAKITYDLEVWLPGENQYREISSCSYFGDFQARRMKARYRDEDGNTQLLHTINGSGLAVGRALVAVIENYQLENGKIKVPSVLEPYLGMKEI